MDVWYTTEIINGEVAPFTSQPVHKTRVEVRNLRGQLIGYKDVPTSELLFGQPSTIIKRTGSQH